MEGPLNKFFHTFKVFKDGQQVHQFECPSSLVGEQAMMWMYPGTPYTIQVLDETGKVRFVSQDLPYGK